MLDPVQWLVRHRDREDVVYECRQCGTTVDSPKETCPSCGSTEIATYPTE